MEFRNCRTCKILFKAWGNQKLCPTCSDQLEEKFREVREYIRDNRNATVSSVSEAMEVSTQQIKQWIREERITFSEDSCGGIECEKCGKMIRTGRFCAGCKSDLINGFTPHRKTPLEEPKQENKNKNKFHTRMG